MKPIAGLKEQIHVWGGRLARRPAAILVVILLVALAPRLSMLTGVGNVEDQDDFYRWAICAGDFNFVGLYRCDASVNHPPVGPLLQGLSFALYRAIGGSLIPYEPIVPPEGSRSDRAVIREYAEANYQLLLDAFQNSPAAVAALKIPGVIFELALISLLFYVARQMAGVWWAALAALGLVLNPGWLAVTAWWGQTDSILGFFLLLTAYLLAKRHPRWAWAAYALAWLTKLQSIMVLPLLLVLSLRRYGLRATLEGLATFALVFGVGMLPFLLGSRRAALVPYLGIDQYPYITVEAYNVWFWVNGGVSWTPDNVSLLGSVTYFQAGMILIGVATVLLCLRVWLVRERDDDYLLWAAACWSFFMLPTQIHERYLYPAMIFLALALVRDRRVIAIYLVAALAFSANILAVAARGNPFLDSVAGALSVWRPTYWALTLTAAYVVLMVIVLKPAVAGIRNRALILTGSRSEAQSY